MFRPLRRLETAWNARTPKFLHNGSKENIIFQLTLAVLIFLGYVVKEKVDDRRAAKARPSYTEDHYTQS